MINEQEVQSENQTYKTKCLTYKNKIIPKWLEQTNLYILKDVPTTLFSNIEFTFLGKDIRNWFSELSVDMDKIQEITK